MEHRGSRWSFLTVFAFANLVLWLGLAVVVGLVVSDGVDFGVETLLRQGQATAAALWDQVSARSTQIAANPDSSTPSWPVAVEIQNVKPTDTLAWPTAPTPVPDAAGQESKETPGEADSEPTPPPRATSSPVAGPTGIAATKIATRQATPTVQPSPTPIDSPLLLADPSFSNLANLNAEMGHSAIGRPVQIRYDEASLNREVATLVANNPNLGYSDVQVDLGRNHVVLSGKVQVVGFDVHAEVLGQIVASNCQPNVIVQDIRIAGFLTPGFVKEGIRDLVLESMNWYPADYPLCLEQIVLEDGRVTVYGSRR
jgi:hypothetical protein